MHSASHVLLCRQHTTLSLSLRLLIKICRFHSESKPLKKSAADASDAKTNDLLLRLAFHFQRVYCILDQLPGTSQPTPDEIMEVGESNYALLTVGSALLLLTTSNIRTRTEPLR